MLGLSNMVVGCVPPMVRCECWACLSDMVVGSVPPMFRYKCWVGYSDYNLDISVEEDLHGGWAYNQQEKGLALYNFL